jgi:hypothetical protein
VIIAGHLEEMFHKQNVAKRHPLLLFRYCVYSLYNVNTDFLQNSTARHLKALPDRKKSATSLKSAQKMLSG